MLTIRNLKIPLVTAVSGPAAGIGASIAMAGDIIVAGKSSYFLEAFCHIGLVPDGGATWMLVRNVGRVRAAELALLGEKIYAEQAYDWGMVTRVVEDDAVMTTAQDFAQRLANGPTHALGPDAPLAVGRRRHQLRRPAGRRTRCAGHPQASIRISQKASAPFCKNAKPGLNRKPPCQAP